MSKELRLKILLLLEGQYHQNPAALIDDIDLLPGTNCASVKQIHPQLDILEAQDLVELHKTMGPTYCARITPQGVLYLEELREKAESRSQPLPKIGF